MLGLIEKLKIASRNRTTYRVGLLQAKAFRILKNHTDDALSKHAISNVDWVFLGLLHDNINGLRLKEMAEELGVEAPFVTSLFNKLEKINLVTSRVDTFDSRAKNIQLTSRGHTFVIATEEYLKDKMKKLLVGAGKSDLLSYVTVLEKIIENSKE